MQLGTIWNNCLLIYYGGRLGGFPPKMEPRILPKWQDYTEVFPESLGYNVWFDLEAGICFSGAHFRGGPAGKDHHFFSDRRIFLEGNWGREFVESSIQSNDVFRNMEIHFDEECIYGLHPALESFRGKSLLIILGGPSTKEVPWQNLSYDYIWSCNKFYENPTLAKREIELLSLAADVPLSGNEELESYVQQRNPLVGFEIDRGGPIGDWREVNAFVNRHPANCFFFHTRYTSAIGVGPRLICLAIFLGAAEIYFVGLDGITSDGPLHAFEASKPSPQWFRRFGHSFQNRQFVVFWDYVLGLRKQRHFSLYNLGELYTLNASRDISRRESALPTRVVAKLQGLTTSVPPKRAG